MAPGRRQPDPAGLNLNLNRNLIVETSALLLRSLTAWRRGAAALLAAVACVLPLAAQATTVRLYTTYGPIDIELYDSAAPNTVANFLAYVRSGGYANSLFHRSVPNFIVQGGGIVWPQGSSTLEYVPARPPIANEYSADRPNVRGTIAMAKRGGDPNSATSQWFFNLVDNTATLGPANNGGFTVFGKATAPSMAAIDAIAALPVVNAGGETTSLPVRNYTTGTQIKRENVVLVSSAQELPAKVSLTASDRIFNYLEAAYPQYANPAGGSTQVGAGYTYRYYATTGAYVGTKDGMVYYLVPSISAEIVPLGTVAEWLGIAEVAGY